MPFQVIRSPGFTYNFFQVILITLGLTFQNLAVDKTNNCKIPLSKLPVRVWLMTSSLVQGQIIWWFKGHSNLRFRSTKSHFRFEAVLDLNLLSIDLTYTLICVSYWFDTTAKSRKSLQIFYILWCFEFYPFPVHILDFNSLVIIHENLLKSLEPWLQGSRFRIGGSRVGSKLIRSDPIMMLQFFRTPGVRELPDSWFRSRSSRKWGPRAHPDKSY